tara:strand:- start:10 stop:459 length:450 start_codon:yes stop_codon:yes gene_type:complete
VSVFVFVPAVLGSELELEDGLGNLQLESGDALLLESSNTGPEFAVQVIDENPVLAIPYYWLQPYLSFQADPATLFEDVWFPGTGQQGQEVLMPVYDERFIGGDIANMPYSAFQMFDNIHFGPDGDGTVQGPSIFDIPEGPADFELRTPE